MKNDKIPVSLPSLNIQWPISELITSGEKNIETRTYPLPKQYLNTPILLVETPGARGGFKARATAIIVFSCSFLYKSKSDFWEDFENHLVAKNSMWDWFDKPKWGWKIKSVLPLDQPLNISKQRGITFTKSIPISVPEHVVKTFNLKPEALSGEGL